MIRRVADEGHAKTAEYIRQTLSRIFQHGVRNLRCNSDPAHACRGAIVVPPATHHRPLSVKELPGFLESIDSYAGRRQTVTAGLQAAFGLRTREAMQLRPLLADKGTFLSITHGTKGGRDRVEPIRTPQQRELLERAKTFCATPSSSTSDPNLKLHQWKNHYYQVVRACGITRKDGITSHGLRHEYANNRYRELTGSDSPVRGGPSAAKETDEAARTLWPRSWGTVGSR